MGRSATFILDSSDFSQTRYPSVGCLGVPLMMTTGCACSSFIASEEASLNSCDKYSMLHIYTQAINPPTLIKTTIRLYIVVAAVRVSGNKCTNIMLANTNLHSTIQIMQVIVLCSSTIIYLSIPSEVHVIPSSYNDLNFAFDSILVISKIFGIVSIHISLMSLLISFSKMQLNSLNICWKYYTEIIIYKGCVHI